MKSITLNISPTPCPWVELDGVLYMKVVGRSMWDVVIGFRFLSLEEWPVEMLLPNQIEPIKWPDIKDNVSSLPPDDFFLPAFDAKELKKIVDKYRNR